MGGGRMKKTQISMMILMLLAVLLAGSEHNL